MRIPLRWLSGNGLCGNANGRPVGLLERVGRGRSRREIRLDLAPGAALAERVQITHAARPARPPDGLCLVFREQASTRRATHHAGYERDGVSPTPQRTHRRQQPTPFRGRPQVRAPTQRSGARSRFSSPIASCPGARPGLRSPSRRESGGGRNVFAERRSLHRRLEQGREVSRQPECERDDRERGHVVRGRREHRTSRDMHVGRGVNPAIGIED